MVKKKCSVEAGVPSQVVTSTVLAKERGIMAIATKVTASVADPGSGAFFDPGIRDG
jgi:hypothetical protein